MGWTFSEKMRLGEILSHNITLEMNITKIFKKGEMDKYEQERIEEEIEEIQTAFEMFKFAHAKAGLLEDEERCQD